MCSVSARMLQEALDEILDVLRTCKLLLLLLGIWRYEVIEYCFGEEVLPFSKCLSLLFYFPPLLLLLCRGSYGVPSHPADAATNKLDQAPALVAYTPTIMHCAA